MAKVGLGGDTSTSIRYQAKKKRHLWPETKRMDGKGGERRLPGSLLHYQSGLLASQNTIQWSSGVPAIHSQPLISLMDSPVAVSIEPTAARQFLFFRLRELHAREKARLCVSARNCITAGSLPLKTAAREVAKGLNAKKTPLVSL